MTEREIAAKIPLEDRYRYVIWDHKMAMEVIRAKLNQKGVDPKVIESVYEEAYEEGGASFVKEWKEKLGLGDDPGSAAQLIYLVAEMWNFEGRKLIESSDEKGRVLATTRDPAWEAIKALDMEDTLTTRNITDKWGQGFIKAFNPDLKITNTEPRIRDGSGYIEVIIERK